MPKQIAKKARIPSETIISVTKGAKCYVGLAGSFRIAGQDVIVIGRNLSQLNIIFNKIAPKETLRVDMCHKVVMMAQAETKIDDEL